MRLTVGWGREERQRLSLLIALWCAVLIVVWCDRGGVASLLGFTAQRALSARWLCRSLVGLLVIPPALIELLLNLDALLDARRGRRVAGFLLWLGLGLGIVAFFALFVTGAPLAG